MEGIDKFKKPDGDVDYEAWNAAYAKDREDRKAKGELCSECGTFIVWSKGFPDRCGDCKALDKPQEVHHHSKIRCPKCLRDWRVGDGDDYHLYEDGDHEVNCGYCGHDFTVITHITYSFESPAQEKDDA